jgi:hypothetical protein
MSSSPARPNPTTSYPTWAAQQRPITLLLERCRKGRRHPYVPGTVQYDPQYVCHFLWRERSRWQKISAKAQQRMMSSHNNQSVAPDGPSMRPTQKETYVAGKKEGQAVRRTGRYQVG